jgi:hypothetical protein
LGLTPTQVANISVVALNLKANAVNVKYTFTFSNLARIPAGSSLYVNFPSTYPQLSNLDPIGSCFSTLASSFCSIHSFGVLITGFAALPIHTSIKVVIDGVKNPTTAAGVAGLTAIAQDSKGKLS